MITITNENKNSYIIKGLSVIFIYFFFSFFQSLPLTLLHINVNTMPKYIKILYSLSIELVMASLIYFIFKQEFKKAFQDIKKNHLKYFNDNLKYYILGIAIMIISNILINLLGGGLSNNETAVRNEFASYPIYTFISAALLAPFVEESVFRLSYRAIFKNDFLFITISSLIFGLLHLLTTPITKLFPLYLLAYSSCGFAFSYMLIKTNNIFVTIGFHFMHNGLTLTLQTIMMIF